MAQSVSDTRVAVALACLKGRPAAEVASEFRVTAEEAEQWTAEFVEGGELRLGGRLDPSSLEARDRFLVLIAHEFRTPLTIIGGWVEAMLGTELDASQRSEALQLIHKQVAHLERIARDALDAGAVAHGHLRLVVEPLPLRELVASVISSLRDARFVLEDGPEIEVVGDASRLEQVTGGILEHARRLSGSGPLEVAVAPRGPQQVSVEATVQGRELSVAEASSLFEPYGRADTSVGTGLGLYLCRALLVAHGGELGIRSRGTATTLWFRLPLAGPDPGPLVERR